MALTDPELDLLRELLADDPSDPVFVQVGEELVRRAVFDEAEKVLADGLKAGQVDGPLASNAWVALARASLECAHYAACLDAWARAGATRQAEAELGRVRILALERSGRVDDARAAVAAFERLHPGIDVVVEAVKERIESPLPQVVRRAADPWLTTELAERYAAMGRADRAIRIYRRILFRHPTDASLRHRLMQLDHQPSEITEDLSEELEDPSMVPPDLAMPAPTFGSSTGTPAPAATPRFERVAPPTGGSGLAEFLANVRQAEQASMDASDPGDHSDVGDADLTQPADGLAAMGLPAPKRRKKRSLLNR